MVLTDPEAKRQLKNFKTPEAREEVELMPEAERNGRTDAQIIQDTAQKFLDLFMEDGTDFRNSLEEAAYILDAAKHGEAGPAEVKRAKATMAEYRQLKRLAETVTYL